MKYEILFKKSRLFRKALAQGLVGALFLSGSASATTLIINNSVSGDVNVAAPVDDIQIQPGASVTGSVMANIPSTISMIGGSIGAHIIGSNGADTFTMANGTIGGSVFLGQGNDTFNISGGSIAGNIQDLAGQNTFNISGGVISFDIIGSDDNNTFQVSGGTIGGSLQTGNGTNQVFLSGDAVINGDVFGGSGNDLFQVTGGTIHGNLQTGHGTNQVFFGGTAIVDRDIFGGFGNDLITVTGGTIHGNIQGNSGDDHIIMTGGIVDRSVLGNSGSNVIQISGGTVSGWVIGGDDLDQITINGTAQTGAIFGNSGNDIIEVGGNAIVQTIQGDLGALSDTGNDIITVRDNATVNVSVPGAWAIGGSGGDDTITILGGTLNGSIRPDSGTNTVLITGGTIGTENFHAPYTGASLVLAGNDTATINGGTLIGGIVAIDASGPAAINISGGQVGTLAGGQSILGGSYGDHINISGTALLTGDVQGGDGNNTINFIGGQINGNVKGGAGIDTILVNGGTLGGMFFGGAGIDTLTTANGTYTVDDMEHLIVQSGELRLNQGTYDTLNTLTAGIVAPLQTSTTITGAINHQGIIDLSRNNATGDIFNIQGAYQSTEGKFKINALMSHSGSTADQIHFFDTVNGTSILEVKGFGPVSDGPGQDALVVDTHSTTTTDNAFRLVHPLAQLGFYNYFLEQRGTQWYLTPKSEAPAPTVDGYARNLVIQYNLARELMDFSKDSKEEWNPWGRYLGKTYDLKLENGRYGTNLYGFQVGIDKRIYHNTKTNTASFLGIFAGYGQTSLTYENELGENSGKGWHGGLYWIYKQDPTQEKAFRVDSSLLWGHQSNMENIYGPSGFKHSYDADVFGANLNAYYGFKVDHGWRIEPGLHLSYGHVEHGAAFTDAAGLAVGKGSIDGLYGEASIKFEKPQYTSGNRYFVPYFKMAVGKNIAGATAETIVHGISVEESSDDFTGSIGIGLKYEASKRHTWELEVNRLMGAERGWYGFGSIKFHW